MEQKALTKENEMEIEKSYDASTMEIEGMKGFDMKRNIEFLKLSLEDLAEIIDMPKYAVEQFNFLKSSGDEEFSMDEKL
eukprot:4758377-Heterocapsa_arctica.AAC.1